jgi:hypothetical protein
MKWKNMRGVAQSPDFEFGAEQNLIQI